MTMASIMRSAAGLCVEAGASRGDDASLGRGDLFAGQGTVVRLKHEPEGATLTPLSDLRAKVFVVQFHAAQDSASRLPDHQNRVAGKRQLWHGYGEVANHGGVFGHRGMPGDAGSGHD